MRRALMTCTLLLGAATAAAAQATPREPLAPDGTFEVVTAPELVLRDAARESDLPVIVVHPVPPTGERRFPVIVFCHGLGGQGSQVLTLPQHWASHGYIVLVPTHRDSMRHRTGQGRKMGGFRGMLNRVRAPKADFQYRPADVRFLLDSLGGVAAKVPALADRIDFARIGVGGHSLGAYTTALAGGTKVDLPGGTNQTSVGDDRVGALLMLSPQGTGQLGLTERSWDDVRRPLMTVTGSEDRGSGGQGPEWRKEPFIHAPPGKKYHLFIQGAPHGFFTKAPGTRDQRRFGREKQKADARPTSAPRAQSGLFRKLLGDPGTPLTGMTDEARAKLVRTLARVVERGAGGSQTQGELYGSLQLLLTQMRDGDWATAEVTRAELLKGSTTTSGEAIDPVVKFDYVKLCTRLFWDAHLKGDARAKTRLESPATLTAAEGTVTLEHE